MTTGGRDGCGEWADVTFRCGHPKTPENTRMKGDHNGRQYPRCRTCLRDQNRQHRRRNLPVNFEARWPILDPAKSRDDLIAEATADIPNVRPKGHRIIRHEWDVDGAELVLRAHALPINNPSRAGVSQGPDFPKLPVEPVLAFTRGKRLEHSQETALERAVKQGRLTIYAADKLAVALGTHPGLIWPEWWTLGAA